MDWDGIASLEAMVAYGDAFIADPGCDVDFDGILAEMPGWEDEEPEAVCRECFRRTCGLLEGRARIVLYRHMTVGSLEGFVEALEAGAAAGAHWSLEEGTSSPFPEQSDVDVLLKGSVDASQVDWFTTFQNFFSCPWEREVTFGGAVRIDWVREVESGQEREFGGLDAPTLAGP